MDKSVFVDAGHRAVDTFVKWVFSTVNVLSMVILDRKENRMMIASRNVDDEESSRDELIGELMLIGGR